MILSFLCGGFVALALYGLFKKIKKSPVEPTIDINQERIAAREEIQILRGAFRRDVDEARYLLRREAESHRWDTMATRVSSYITPNELSRTFFETQSMLIPKLEKLEKTLKPEPAPLKNRYDIIKEQQP